MKVDISRTDSKGKEVYFTLEELLGMLEDGDSRSNWKISDLDVHDNDGFFPIPNMRLHRDDIEEYITEAKNLTNDQVQFIAGRLGNLLLDEFHACLKSAVEEFASE